MTLISNLTLGLVCPIVSNGHRLCAEGRGNAGIAKSQGLCRPAILLPLAVHKISFFTFKRSRIEDD
jgi:hypothetical protein